MRKQNQQIIVVAALLAVAVNTSCNSQNNQAKANSIAPAIINLKPSVITDTVGYDTDDPAIWINPQDPAQSLIVGTDKYSDGGLYVFNLDGKIINKVTGLKRPNNVDIAYGLDVNGKPTDVAITTEREKNAIRIFSLPDMKPIDNGGISVFEGEQERWPMGISIYTRPTDHAMFAIVGRKSGPADGYLWQYRLSANAKSMVKGELVRKFGKYSGKKEIESIAVDNEAGYI
ncbi:MAG: phytase [Sphingobacteriales bacterium]|nr:MAG: phytase [Sphingobacteriales bacterium]